MGGLSQCSFTNRRASVGSRLKGIRSFVTPELYQALFDAGQGDRIVLTSTAFPAASIAKQSHAALVRINGETVTAVLREIMKFIKV